MQHAARNKLYTIFRHFHMHARAEDAWT